MKLLSVDNYIKFECIGGECPISCCGGNWSIIIDDESYDKYMAVEGEFGEKLKDNIIKIEDRHVFRLDDKTGDCVFLNENKLCSIYRKLGPDALCVTCKSYPRSLIEVGDITIWYLMNSCPEVNRMIMQRTDQFSTLYDDSTEDDEVADKPVPYGFNDALRAYNTGLHLMQDFDIQLSERLYLMLFYTDRFQSLVNAEQNVTDLINVFSKPEIYRILLENRPDSDYDYADLIHVFTIVYKYMMADSYDHPMWIMCRKLADDIVSKDKLNAENLMSAFEMISRDEEIQRELGQLMAYRFFVVFMRGFDKKDYLDHIAYELLKYSALTAYIALTYALQGHKSSQEERILFYSLCSRIEHGERKCPRLISELKQEGFYSLDRLIKLIG